MLQRFETRSSDPRPNNHLIAVPMTCQSAILQNWSGWQRSRREEVREWRERELAHVFVGPSAELQCRPCWNVWFQQDGKRGEFHRCRFGQRQRAAADVRDKPGMKPRPLQLR